MTTHDDNHVTPLVSVCSVTFNHKKFVRQAIDGFLMQKTSFPIEILIHDDVSTDGTVEILKHYRDAHPNLIRLVLQTENQFSQYKDVYSFVYNIASGKYIALCEGDDYWSDPSKLQTQADLLENRPDASGCFHSTDDLSEADGCITPNAWGPPGRKSLYHIDDLLPRLTFAQTGSMMLRKECLKKVPDWGKGVSHGDFGYLAVALLDGPMLYIDKPMSVYRRHGGAYHSTTYGSIADFRALQTLVNVGHTLGLQNRPSYLEGIRWRMEQLENSINRDKVQTKTLIADLNETLVTYERARRSKFFRAGVAVDRLRKQFFSVFRNRTQESE